MCGIFVVVSPSVSPDKINEYLGYASRLDHRGTSSSYTMINRKIFMYHRRLAINDMSSNGTQPFVYDNVYSLCNGEILNYVYLKSHCNDATYASHSDCEVIGPLYRRYSTRFVTKLQGMYAGVVYDSIKNNVVVFRDRYGIVSLYYGYTPRNELVIASEIKALTGLCTSIHCMPPGKIMLNGTLINYSDDKWTKSLITNSSDDGLYSSRPQNVDFDLIHRTLEYRIQIDDLYDIHGTSGITLRLLKSLLLESVRANSLLSDANLGFLLSGGVDSSLVVSIAHQHTNIPMNTFTIGLLGSPDVIAAESVVSYLNDRGRKVNHTSYTFTIEEAISCLPDVISSIETYDITTVRASIPMYILMKRIKAFTDISVILSGEGADEIFSGYAYNEFAPSSQELHDEAVEKLSKLHLYDNRRSHLCGMSNTIEIRPPFLYKPLIDYVMNIHPVFRHPKSYQIEKYILRKTFDDGTYLPDSVLWRRKEQFSDGISCEVDSRNNLIDCMKNYADRCVSDEDFANRHALYSVNVPLTKEQMMYRRIYDSLYKTHDHIEKNDISVACSTARVSGWMDLSKHSNDPSGRLSRYSNSKDLNGPLYPNGGKIDVAFESCI